MHEGQKRPELGQPEIVTLHDLAELAFWDVDFTDNAEKLRQYVSLDEARNVLHFEMREKAGNDIVGRNVPFNAVQIRCSYLNDMGEYESSDLILISWRDGLKNAVDITDLHTEQKVIVPGDSNATGELDTEIPDVIVRRQIKTALTQLIDII